MAIIDFPPVESADEHGLLAVGGDLEVSSLKMAYERGIFPWPISLDIPLAWFSPDPRGVLFHRDIYINRSLKKWLNKKEYYVTFNKDFPQVIIECSKVCNRPGQDTTWITDRIIDSYIDFHYSGHAYSVEVYDKKDKLKGGLYGVRIGKFFSGESMFHKESNTSKLALLSLMKVLKDNQVTYLDTQMVTPVVENLGGREIPRDDFLALLKSSIQHPHHEFHFPNQEIYYQE